MPHSKTQSSEEAARSRELRLYGILDTGREEDFNDIVAIAADLCDVPISLVTLIDQDRQWIKASRGIDLQETPRSEAFCNTAIEHPTEVLVVRDAQTDPRFAEFPIVRQAPKVRFYAGAPLVSREGRALGAICVLDTQPRELSATQINHLKTLSRRLMAELELRRKNQELEIAEAKSSGTIEALRRMQTQFQLALSGYPGGLWDLDLASGDVDFSAGYWSMLGYEEGAGPRNLAESMALVHPDDAALVETEFQRHLTAETGRFEVEFRMKALDGKYKWFLSNGQTFGAEGAPPDRVVGLIRDITERKVKERALAQRERAMRLAQRIAGLGSWYLDLSTNKVTWSEQLYVMLGLDPNRDPPDYDEHMNLFTAESWAMLSKAVGRTQETGHPYELEIEFVRPDKSQGWMMARGECVYNEENELIGLQGTAQDITARREADQRLSEQAALINRARDAFIVRDMADKVIFWSTGAEQIYGYASTEAVGKSFHELLTPDPETFPEAKRATLENGQWNGELVKRTQAGEILVIEARWTLLRDQNGNPKSILTTDTDITEKKKIEAQFLRAQRMEGIGTLAGGIAHDLNNVLSPVIMGMAVLRTKVSDERGQMIINSIENSAKRGAELVKQVLSFARGVEGSRVPLQLKHLTQEVEGIVENTFPKNIEMTVQVPKNLPLVTGDPTQLNQILLNLCVNARDAMPRGGRIEIMVKAVELDEQYASMNRDARAGHFLTIEVADTGCGIPPEILNRIYEPFFTTKEIGTGTGLGLSTVLGIVRSHGGFITTYSEVNRGTTFRVYLPVADSPEDTAADVDGESLLNIRGEGELILVVDDEKSILETTKQTLESFGYRALVASDGAEAISLFAARQTEITLVLTDMMMPIMDGPALIAAIKHIRPSAKVIAASGLAANGGVARVSALGVKHFLAKPYSAEEMLKLLRRVIRGVSRPPLPLSGTDLD